MISIRSFKEHIHDNIMELFSIRVFALPAGFLIMFIVIDPKNWFHLYWLLLKNPTAWCIWIAGSIADALIRAAYWYFYERSPRYKRRQEALAQYKADKALKASGHVEPKPDLLTYLQEMNADKSAKKLPLEVSLTEELKEYWQASGTNQSFVEWAKEQWDGVCRANRRPPRIE